MSKSLDATAVPSPDWQQPVATWSQAIDRYITFVQVPAWRASIKRGGGEKPRCLTADQARALETNMQRILNRLAIRRGVAGSECHAAMKDLEDLWSYRGRHVPRPDRCSNRLHWHFQRVFLLNAGGYTCCYCGRTAWGVYAEETGDEPRRTLRFEIDHRVTRGALPDSDCFDPKNLVAACRSCNTIKAEIPEFRFLLELKSLSAAVHQKLIGGSSTAV